MEKISFFLEKFKKLGLPNDVVRSEFVRIVESMGFEVNKEDVSVRRDNLYANVSPALKSELYVRKKEILDKLFVACGKKTPNNIF